MWGVRALNVALQLERRGELAVAVLTGGVVFPALAALLLQFQMVLHVVHKPNIIFKDFQATEALKSRVSLLLFLGISFALAVVKVTH